MNVDLALKATVDPSTLDRPALDDIGVLALVPERWGGMWLSRHQVLTRLARYFHVVWYNPPRSWRKLTHPVVSTDPTPPPANGFEIYDHEPWLPKFYKPRALDQLTEQARLQRARKLLEQAGCRRVIAYAWRPEFVSALDLVAHDVSCYHIADEYSFADVEHEIPSDERELIERVDQVFVHSPALLEKKGNINPHTEYVTNGVDYAAFATPAAEPADLASIPHPRIGYVGRIKSQMDWKTLIGIARARPDWSLVLVGPLGHIGRFAGERTELFGLPNVHYLGNRSVGEVPAYIQHMDVCLLCYALTDYTRYIFPLKLHEYLATGVSRRGIGHPDAARFRLHGAYRAQRRRVVRRHRGVPRTRGSGRASASRNDAVSRARTTGISSPSASRSRCVSGSAATRPNGFRAGPREKGMTVTQRTQPAGAMTAASGHKALGCRFCGEPLSLSFTDLGMSPLCQKHVKPSQLNDAETFYPLHAFVCTSCWLVQLGEFATPGGDLRAGIRVLFLLFGYLAQACARLL